MIMDAHSKTKPEDFRRWVKKEHNVIEQMKQIKRVVRGLIG
jgi:hypothetical protein